MRTLAGEKGVALITSLFFLVIVTALAAGALMLATVQVQVSGSVARMERAYAAAEACKSYVFPLVTSIHYNPYEPVPPEYGAMANDPAEEIGKKQVVSSGDPYNLLCQAVDNFTAQVDIDWLGTVMIAGGSIEASGSYHKSKMSSSEMNVYRVTSTATTGISTGEQSTVCQAIYLKIP